MAKRLLCAVLFSVSLLIPIFAQDQGADEYKSAREALANKLFPEQTAPVIRLRDAFAQVKREDFVGDDYRSIAYRDMPLPESGGILQPAPSMIASILKAAEPDLSTRVLIIGRNTAYISAIISLLSENVYVSDPLMKGGTPAPIHLKNDLSLNSWHEQAPFDVIILFGSVGEIPRTLSVELNQGGKLIFPLESTDGNQTLISAEKYYDGFSIKVLGKSYIHKLMTAN